jgi:hypothetical protein
MKRFTFRAAWNATASWMKQARKLSYFEAGPHSFSACVSACG